MRLTLYEIETIMRKASIGLGLHMGLAEDIGCAVAWLATRGKDGVGAAVNSINSGMNKMNMQTGERGRMIFPDAQIAVCGPSAIDLLIGEKSCTEVQILNPDAVTLLFGFAGVAAGHHNCAFQFDFTNGARVTITGDEIAEQDGALVEDCDVTVSLFENEMENNVAKLPCNSVEIDDELWREAEALAAKTYVAESDGSRTTGAGAGLSDND